MGRKKIGVAMKLVNHFLPTHQLERIKAQSLRTGLDRSTIIRLAIDDYLNRAERRHDKTDNGEVT